jgi:hypothetical protein
LWLHAARTANLEGVVVDGRGDVVRNLLELMGDLQGERAEP